MIAKHRHKLAPIFLLALVLPTSVYAPPAHAQEGYQPTTANLAARTAYQDAKFGLFIHWGVYSVLGDGEWVMNQRHLTVEEYEKLPAFFNPTEFNPAEWVALAKAAGMKYITITSKHHDGFAMFGTKQSDWNTVDRTPYKKDVLKMLADECHRQDMKLAFYYSQLDWHNSNYYPRGRTGHDAGRPENGDWYKYLDYMDAQLRELLTNYGEIAGIWFDGMWDKPDADWRLATTYKLIHDLQPQALVGSNHHHAPYPGEDFQMFEKDLPGQNASGRNQTAVISNALPLETAETMNIAWGFDIGDAHYKSTRQLIQYLVKAAGQNANFLLNVGPMPNGRIQPEFQTRLREMGEWLGRYGESIYGTRGGPITPRPWGVTTQKGNKVYVHILDWQDATLMLPALPAAVKSVRFLKNGSLGTIAGAPDGWALPIPDGARDDVDTIAVLELKYK